MNALVIGGGLYIGIGVLVTWKRHAGTGQPLVSGGVLGGTPTTPPRLMQASAGQLLVETLTWPGYIIGGVFTL